MKLIVKTGRLDGNLHDMRPKPGGPHPRYERHDFFSKRSCISVVALGRECYLKREGRTLIGRRLWIYFADASCWHLDIMLKFKRSPYYPWERYGPKDDDGLGTVML